MLVPRRALATHTALGLFNKKELLQFPIFIRNTTRDGAYILLPKIILLILKLNNTY